MNDQEADSPPRRPQQSPWRRCWRTLPANLWGRKQWRSWRSWWQNRIWLVLRRSAPPSLSDLTPRQIGQLGEQLAADYLTSAGYQLVALGFQGPIGHQSNGTPIDGEIDLIAYDPATSPPTLVFIEVKTRRSTRIATPEAAVDRRKRARLRRTARLSSRIHHLSSPPVRFDVLTLVLEPNHPARLSHFKDFFPAEASFPSRSAG